MKMQLFLEEMRSQILFEQFSNWEYKPPEDPELLLYDFYFFTLAGKSETGNDIFNYALKQGLEKAVNNLTTHMLSALRFSISSELRHAPWETSVYANPDEKFEDISEKAFEFYNTLEEFSKNDKTPFGKTKSPGKRMEKISAGSEPRRINAVAMMNSIMKKLKLSKIEFANIAIELFDNILWSSAYGGENWAKIAKAYQKLLKAKKTNDKMVWIDHAYDLQHNNGSVLDKLDLYYKDNYEYSWLLDALNWKKDLSDITDFYHRVSPQLKPIVAYVAKNVFGKTIEDKTKGLKDKKAIQQWKGKVWKGGEWTGGIWYNGTWKDGYWENGEWYDGVWEGGEWGGGIWHDGVWEDGYWDGGTWKDGEWKKGRWSTGDWVDGIWRGGKWDEGNIWSKKFKEFIFSYVDPNEFKKHEKLSKDVLDLEQRINDY